MEVSEMSASSEIPIGLALIPCDTIIEDRLTGKKSLIGICGNMAVDKFPFLRHTMYLLISMTGGTGEYPCEVVLSSSLQNETIFSAKGKIKFENPNQVMDMVLVLKNVRFPSADIYWIKVSVDDVPLMMRPLTVNAISDVRKK